MDHQLDNKLLHCKKAGTSRKLVVEELRKGKSKIQKEQMEGQITVLVVPAVQELITQEVIIYSISCTKQATINSRVGERRRIYSNNYSSRQSIARVKIPMKQ